MDTPGGRWGPFCSHKNKGVNICKDQPRDACAVGEECGKTHVVFNQGVGSKLTLFPGMAINIFMVLEKENNSTYFSHTHTLL